MGPELAGLLVKSKRAATQHCPVVKPSTERKAGLKWLYIPCFLDRHQIMLIHDAAVGKGLREKI